jgi:hypothetical protein
MQAKPSEVVPPVQKETLTALQAKAQKLLKATYNVTVTKFDLIILQDGGAKKEGSQFDEAKLKQRFLTTPIDELGIESTALDGNVLNNILQEPLFIEIKELRNVSQPF